MFGCQSLKQEDGNGRWITGDLIAENLFVDV